jgi:hypothetical protein
MRKYSFFLKINEYESIVYTNKNIHPHINHKKIMIVQDKTGG